MRTNKNLLVLAALAAAVLLAVLLALLAGRPAGQPDPGRQVNIYLDGQLFRTAHLGQDREVTVKGRDGAVNVIRMDDEGVWMESSTCHNQLCVHQGKVTYQNYAGRYYGTNIICLPNRVTVELVLQEGERDPDAPDT